MDVTFNIKELKPNSVLVVNKDKIVECKDFKDVVSDVNDVIESKIDTVEKLEKEITELKEIIIKQDKKITDYCEFIRKCAEILKGDYKNEEVK